MAKNRNGNRLRTRRWVDAPLRELSGICLRRHRNRRRFQVAIGDREAKIAWFLLPDDEDADNEWRISDISNLPGSMLPAHDPQIEVVCGKPEGLAFTGQGCAVVGLDTPKGRNNLVLLEPAIAFSSGSEQ